jgi:peptide deformylase
MRIYPIRLFPDPALRKKAVSANWNARQTQEFIKNLIATLYAQPSGIGIAAPQVGISERVIIVDVSSKDPHKTLEVMINPRILRLDGEILSREGCMSLPDYTANVKRASRIQIEWTDKEGRLHRRATEGIEAICLQHEIDHLNGLLFIDRVASLKTEVFVRKRRAK